MKKILSLLSAAVCLLCCLLPAAAAGTEEPDASPVPVYGNQLKDGTYAISVDSSASMFRVVACDLTVQNGELYATMTMSGKGYDKVFLGSREQAAQAAEEEHIPFALNDAEQKTFTVPVSALNTEIDCAAWSIKRSTWYDRVLVFESEDLPADAFRAADVQDGTYTVGVTLSGGSGRAEITSPALVTAVGGTLTASVEWSSPYYEYMLVNGTRFDPVQAEGNSTFEIPVVLDEDMTVSALTVAMSEPHLVDYTLHFDRSTLETSGSGHTLLIAVIVLAAMAAAAINSVPRQMIRENLEEVCRLTDYPGGLSVVISVPEGERLAQKTFNPRLGIVGGISILGTTGIVEPMSEQALVDTIRVELRQRKADGAEYVLLTPGNYGADFIQNTLGIDPAIAVQTSNFIGDTLDLCRELGFRGALLVGHIGKLVKLAGGMFNTHSKYGDCRMEILAAHGAACGLSPEAAQELLSCVACDDALRILQEEGICSETLARLTDRVGQQLSFRTGGELETGAVLFSKVYGPLGKTKHASRLIKLITEE